MNIAQHVERGRALSPQHPAIIFEEQTLSYYELDGLASRVGHVLQVLGVAQGDRVALFLPNIPEFVIAYLGALKIGAIAVSINTLLQTPELAFLLGDCEPSVVITTADLRARLPHHGRDQPWRVITVEGQDDLDFARLVMRAPSDLRAQRLPASAPAAIVYTSGTTGLPKGVTLSHGNVISNMIAKVFYCGTRARDRLLLALPLFHCFGQNAILNNALHAGATIVLQRRFAPGSAVEAIQRHRISMLFGVPTMYIKLLEQQPPRPLLQTVGYSFVAGASMPPSIAEHWREQYGQPVYEGYGLTETAPFASYNHQRRYRPGSIGTPIRHVEMRVVDEQGLPQAPGERGEIAVRGPNVMLGYWRQPDATAQAMRGGWFHTGDIGIVDDEGYFYVVDRLKDMINVSGFKVYPAEVERAFYQHPAVAEAAVYGVPDPIKGEAVRASIRLRAGCADTAEDLRLFCRSQMASYKVPEQIAIVSTLPKNATGKILRDLLRTQAA